jgi:hypothetical protein
MIASFGMGRLMRTAEGMGAQRQARIKRQSYRDREAVLSPRVRRSAMAESDEYWSYLMPGAYALVGEADQALSWLEHATPLA